jgi:hypothetical protein
MQETNITSNIIPFSDLEGVTQVSKQRFVIHPSLKQQRYTDLEFFRQQIEESKAGLHHQPYTNQKRATKKYQWTFFSFAFLFFALTLITVFIPSAVGCGFLFSSCTLLKGGIVTVSGFLSLSALLVALALKIEKEAIYTRIKKAKAHLAAIYVRKQVRLGIKKRLFFTSNREIAITLKHMYQETYDLINDKKEETMHLVNRIVTAETLQPEEKEDLLNQALEELHDKLQHLLHQFRHAMPSCSLSVNASTNS